jgi:hypothetical protein
MIVAYWFGWHVYGLLLVRRTIEIIRTLVYFGIQTSDTFSTFSALKIKP